jgi:hypothetical protein
MALALSLMCLLRYDRPTMGIEEDLAARYARTRFLENLHVAAMALYALGRDRHTSGAFDV